MLDFKITCVNHDFEPLDDSSCRVLKSKIFNALAMIVKRHRLDDQMEVAWLDINSDCEII